MLLLLCNVICCSASIVALRYSFLSGITNVRHCSYTLTVVLSTVTTLAAIAHWFLAVVGGSLVVVHIRVEGLLAEGVGNLLCLVASPGEQKVAGLSTI